MNLMIVPGMFVCSSFLISVCMFIVSIAWPISSATTERSTPSMKVLRFGAMTVIICENSTRLLLNIRCNDISVFVLDW